MHVANARHVLPQFRRRIATGERDMARIVQQTDLGAGDAHQMVDIIRGFDVGPHVVMVRETHAAGGQMSCKGAEALAVGVPLGVGGEARPPRQGFRASLDRIGNLAIDHDLRAVRG